MTKRPKTQLQLMGKFPDVVNGYTARAATPRPNATAGKTVFTYSGESSGLPYSDAPNIVGKSYSITAEVEIPQRGAEG